MNSYFACGVGKLIILLPFALAMSCASNREYAHQKPLPYFLEIECIYPEDTEAVVANKMVPLISFRDKEVSIDCVVLVTPESPDKLLFHFYLHTTDLPVMLVPFEVVEVSQFGKQIYDTFQSTMSRDPSALSEIRRLPYTLSSSGGDVIVSKIKNHQYLFKLKFQLSGIKYDLQVTLKKNKRNYKLQQKHYLAINN